MKQHRLKYLNKLTLRTQQLEHQYSYVDIFILLKRMDMIDAVKGINITKKGYKFELTVTHHSTFYYLFQYGIIDTENGTTIILKPLIPPIVINVTNVPLNAAPLMVEAMIQNETHNLRTRLLSSTHCYIWRRTLLYRKMGDPCMEIRLERFTTPSTTFNLFLRSLRQPPLPHKWHAPNSNQSHLHTLWWQQRWRSRQPTSTHPRRSTQHGHSTTTATTTATTIYHNRTTTISWNAHQTSKIASKIYINQPTINSWNNNQTTKIASKTDINRSTTTSWNTNRSAYTSINRLLHSNHTRPYRTTIPEPHMDEASNEIPPEIHKVVPTPHVHYEHIRSYTPTPIRIRRRWRDKDW